MSFSVLMTYDKTIYMTTYLVSFKTREITYLFSISKYHKGEDTPISVEIHFLQFQET